MATKTIAWGEGDGSITLTYDGSGNGAITVTSSDNNLFTARSKTITVQTVDGSVSRTVTINQAARSVIDLSTAVVTAANQTYSGSALTPVPTVTLNGETVPSTGYDVTYSNNTNAGTATVTVTGKGEYTGSASGSFTIAKANPVYTAPSASVPTYSGSAQNLVSAGSSSHGTFTYATSQSGTYSSTIPQGTNAGTYTVWWKFTGDANHNNVSATQVSGVSIATKSLSITAKAQTITYGGSIATGTGQVTTSGLVTGDSLTAITLTASTSNVPGGTITPSAASTTKGIGNYSVTYTTGTLTINKAAPTYTAPTANSLTYSGGSQYLITTGSTSHGTIYYSSNNSTWTTTRPTGTNAGSYTSYWKLVGDSNHSDIASTSISTTIAQANGVAGVSSRSLTYNRSAQNLVTVSGNTGTVHYRLGTSGSWTTTIPTATNASTSYTVYYYVDASSDGNYKAVGSSSSPSYVTSSIAKVTPVLSTSPSLRTGLSYTGSAQNLLSGGAMKHSSSDSTSVAGTFTYTQQTNAGTYSNPTWTFTPSSTTNYNSASGTVTGSVTIAQATGSVTTAPTNRGVTYSGSSQYIVTAGSGTGTMYYRYKLSTSSSWSSWSTTRPSRTTAGTYNVEYYCAASSDGNYTASATGSLNATIAKASRTISFSNPTTSVEPGSTVTNTATVSAGSGDGTITYSSGNTSVATVNSSTGVVTGVASGSAVITASISEGTNYLSASTTYTIAVQASIINFDYTGSVQSATLGAGTYKLECWGAQGGSNAAASSYSITAKAGGKGGYSTGQLTLTSPTTVYVFVGGQGSSSGNGGWNGGGGGSGSSSYNASNTNGVSRMGGGGGATDIALTTSTMSYSSYRTNRSSASLLSRMIVAGGGAGGAMCYRGVTTTTTSWETVATFTSSNSSGGPKYSSRTGTYNYWYNHVESYLNSGETYKLVRKSGSTVTYADFENITSTNQFISRIEPGIDTAFTWNPPSNMNWVQMYIGFGSESDSAVVELQKQVTSTVVTPTTTYQNGYVGGGTTGKAYNTTWQAKQNAAGSNGGFGYGANQTNTNYRFCSACGGGGWYGGGGGDKSDTDMAYAGHCGGGSGFVNTSANSSYRPSGYTGSQLDSGSTYDGSQTFKAPSGSNETGHSGNGYARITRL